MRAKDIGRKLHETGKKAAQNQEASIDNGGSKDQMRDAARQVPCLPVSERRQIPALVLLIPTAAQVQVATYSLAVDDTPKGRLNATLKKVAEVRFTQLAPL